MPNAESDAPRCNCSLGWQFQKGNGPDPARCPVHGDPTTVIPPEGCYCLFENGVIVRTDDLCPFHSKRPGVRVIPPDKE